MQVNLMGLDPMQDRGRSFDLLVPRGISGRAQPAYLGNS